MGRIKVTASQSQAAWQPLPAGDYNLQVDSVEVKPAKTGNAQMVFKMTVIDGPSAGKTAMHFQSLSEKSGGFIKELIEAAGLTEVDMVETAEINPEDGKPFLDIDFDPDDFIGHTFTAKCVLSDWEGKDNNKFSRFRAIEAQEAAAPTPRRTAAAAQPAARTAAAPATRAAAAQPAAAAAQRRTRSL